jgi:hypothetical protein
MTLIRGNRLEDGDQPGQGDEHDREGDDQSSGNTRALQAMSQASYHWTL